MRSLHYKSFSFRLNSKTVGEIREIKKTLGLSYNLMFSEIIKEYKKSKKIINPKKERNIKK